MHHWQGERGCEGVKVRGESLGSNFIFRLPIYMHIMHAHTHTPHLPPSPPHPHTGVFVPGGAEGEATLQ